MRGMHFGWYAYLFICLMNALNDHLDKQSSLPDTMHKSIFSKLFQMTSCSIQDTNDQLAIALKFILLCVVRQTIILGV